MEHCNKPPTCNQISIIFALLLSFASVNFAQDRPPNATSFLLGSVPVGERCSTNDDCLWYPQKTLCVTALGRCWCNPQHVVVETPTESTCEPIRNQIGEECVDTEQCVQGTPGDLSDCLPSEEEPWVRVCLCNDEAVKGDGSDHQCYLKLNKIGDKCETNSQCQFNLGPDSECSFNTDPNLRQCICTVGKGVSNEDQTKCLPIRNQLGETCEIREQCYFGVPGEYSDCLDVGEDDDGQPIKACQCQDGAINEELGHVCYPVQDEVGDDCKVDVQCTENLGDFSECRDDKCECMSRKAIPNLEQTKCLALATEVGNECKDPRQCRLGLPGDHSDCIGSPTEDDPERMECHCIEDAVKPPTEEQCFLKANLIGDLCEHDIQCTENLSDMSTCEKASGQTEGRCNCLAGSAIPSGDRKKCLKIENDIGAPCEEDLQCQQGESGELSMCLEGECTCSDEAVSEPGENICRLKANKLGDPCLRNGQCKANLGPIAECLWSQSCHCIAIIGVPNDAQDYCLPVVNNIGGTCSEDQQCTEGIPGVLSECTEGTCTCKDGAFHEAGEHKCLQRAGLVGDPCEVSEQCQQRLGNESRCEGDTCQCIAGVSFENEEKNKCLPILYKLEESCEHPDQCKLGAPGAWSDCLTADQFPYRPVCRCVNEAVPEVPKNTCHLKATFVGDDCEIDDQCTANIGNLTECTINGRCYCVSPAVPNLEGDVPETRCIPGGFLIGMPCSDRAQCVGKPGETSTCEKNGYCRCLDGYTSNSQLNDCLKVQDGIGTPCKEAVQCREGPLGRMSDCFDGFCNCTSDAINENGRDECRTKATFVGDPCVINQQCLANLEKSLCQEGKCVCTEGTVESKTRMKCVLQMDLGEPCDEDNQCRHMDHVSCKGGNSGQSTCQCDVGYDDHPYENNQCMKLATLIGDSCDIDPSQCRDLLEGGATCDISSGLCQCNEVTQVVSQSRLKCLSLIPALNEPCEESQQCEVRDSVCQNLPGSGRQCICEPNNFVEYQSTCIPMRSRIGEQCINNVQCSRIGINATVQCLLNQCACPSYADFYNNYCVTPARLRQRCDSDDQCHLGVNNYTHCLNQDSFQGGTCTCLSSAFEQDNECWVSKAVGDYCTRDKECEVAILGEVYCNERTKRCSCKDGFESDFGGLLCNSASSMGIHLFVIFTGLFIKMFSIV